MKMTLKTLSMAAAAALAALCFSACDGKDDKNDDLSKQEQALKASIQEYVPSVIYTIYGNLADETENLYKQLDAIKKSGSLKQADLDKAAETFLNARSWWEKSEAFLYGAATAYGIDPHIDTWPLNKVKLAKSLSDSGTIADLDENGADDVDAVGAASLGFHGIEFILFRNGSVRRPASFDTVEDDEAFNGVSVSFKNEIIFATAVAEDLMNYCFQLQCAWDPKAPADRIEYVEELEVPTTMDSGLTFGENLLSAGEPGSTYRTLHEAAASILVAGCSNICNEVAYTKIGTAHAADATDEDKDYIESPYSKKSYYDFKDNILSIQYSLFGSANASSASSKSLLSFLKDFGYEGVTTLESDLKAALSSLDACISYGAFVDEPTSDVASKAIVAIGKLDDDLNDAAEWIAKL